MTKNLLVISQGSLVLAIFITSSKDNKPVKYPQDHFDFCTEYKSQSAEMSLKKLMVSHDLPRSAIANQIAFNQRDLYSTYEFERTMDRRCQVLVSKLETSDTITFT